MPDSSTYWAMLPPDEAVGEIGQRVSDYYRACETLLPIRIGDKAWALKYGLSNQDGANAFGVMRAGTAGELAKWRVNHWGTHHGMRVTLATQNEPHWIPVPANSDFKSQSQSVVCTTLLDYEYRAHRVNRFMLGATDTSQWAGEGFTMGLWDPNKGEPVPLAQNPETGQQLKEGDFSFFSLTPRNVARDYTAYSFDSCDWLTARVPANKWNLAARYPEKAEALIAMDARASTLDKTSWAAAAKSDQIWLHHFFHRRTDACPNGRYMVIAGDECLFDGPLPFRDIPIYRLTEQDWEGTPFGWTQLWNGIGIQEVLDALTTAITTNQLATAVQLLIIFKNSGFDFQKVTQALATIEVSSPQMVPQSINLTQTKAEIFQFRDKLIQELGIISAVNETALGVASPNIKSGQMAALYDSTALRAASPLQKAFFRHAEDLGTFMVHCIADFAPDSMRTVRIAGEQNKGLVLSFKGSDLEGIDRVTVEVVNSALKTVTGKMAGAELLLSKGALGSGEMAGQRFVQFARTGDLDQLTEGPQGNVLRIKQENEALARGEEVPVTPFDPHWAEIPEHVAGVLSNLAARSSPEAVQATIAHVQTHLSAWAAMTPDMLLAMNGPQSPMAAPPPMPGAPGQTPPPAPGEPSGTPPPAPGGPPSQAAPQGPESLGVPTPPLPPKPGGEDYDPTNTGAVSA